MKKRAYHSLSFIFLSLLFLFTACQSEKKQSSTEVSQNEGAEQDSVEQNNSSSHLEIETIEVITVQQDSTPTIESQPTLEAIETTLTPTPEIIFPTYPGFSFTELLPDDILLPISTFSILNTGFLDTLQVFSGGGNPGCDGSFGFLDSFTPGDFVILCYSNDLNPENVNVTLTTPDQQIFTLEPILGDLFCVDKTLTLLEGEYHILATNDLGNIVADEKFEVTQPDKPTIFFDQCSKHPAVAPDFLGSNYFFDDYLTVLEEGEPFRLLYDGFPPNEPLDIALFQFSEAKSYGYLDPAAPEGTTSYSNTQPTYEKINSWVTRTDENGRLIQYVHTPILPADGLYTILVMPISGDNDQRGFGTALANVSFVGFKSFQTSEIKHIPSFESGWPSFSRSKPEDLPETLLISPSSIPVSRCGQSNFSYDHGNLMLCDLSITEMSELHLKFNNTEIVLDTLESSNEPVYYCLDSAWLQTSNDFAISLLTQEGSILEISTSASNLASPSVTFTGGGLADLSEFGFLCNSMITDKPNTILYDGFSPNESLEVVVYRFSDSNELKFYAHWFTNVDENGRLAERIYSPYPLATFESSQDFVLMVLGEEVPRDENLINTAKAITVFRAIGRQELKTEPSEKFPHMAPLIYIPGGAFRMGGNTDIDNFVEDIELPVHEVLISEFWIEETEVSNINYKQCVEAGSCSKPLATSSATRPNYYVDPEYDSYPVINVNYEQARTYCQWAGGRLPTEAEWEKAARFGGNLIYPWGFGPPSPENNNPNSINHSNIFGDTNPIFSLTFPNLIHHLAGNVWEWVSDWHSGDYYSVSPESNPTGPETGTERVVRGGSWSSDPEFLRTTNRFSRDPENGYDNVGFRCVTTEDPYP